MPNLIENEYYGASNEWWCGSEVYTGNTVFASFIHKTAVRINIMVAVVGGLYWFLIIKRQWEPILQ